MHGALGWGGRQGWGLVGCKCRISNVFCSVCISLFQGGAGMGPGGV